MMSIKAVFRPFFLALRSRVSIVRRQTRDVFWSRSEKLLLERKGKLLIVIATVQGKTLRLRRHVMAARTMADVHSIRGDLYSVLAVQGGEHYAIGVLDGTVTPRQGEPDTDDSGFFQLERVRRSSPKSRIKQTYDQNI
jgi:hypothetical protein